MNDLQPITIITSVIFSIVAVFAIIRFAWRTFDSAFPKLTIQDYQRGVKYLRGKLIGTVEPGSFRYRAATTEIIVSDIREQILIVPGQEVLSSDALGFKLSLQVQYRISDPVAAQSVVSYYITTLYADVHAATRKVVEAMTGEEILAKRVGIGSMVEEIVKAEASRYGVEIRSVTIRDCMLPGNLKQIYAKVAEAKQEGLAAMERARGETAAMRSLANAARAMENNPNLGFLRLIQSSEKNQGNHLILIPPQLTRFLNEADPKSGSIRSPEGEPGDATT